MVVNSSKNKPLLVTGSHRSGSTWVGRMLSLSPKYCYVHEPFHINHDPGICRSLFKYWFTYICEKNEAHFYEALKDTIYLKYDLFKQLRSARGSDKIKRGFRDYIRFTKKRLTGARALLKDPIALFSAEWLEARFNMDIIILIRHPAAFASSIKKKKWTHPFSHFVDQPLLMADYLHPFKEEIDQYAIQEIDILDQAALLWKITHYMILIYHKRHPNWIFIRHEDISLDPETKFREIFNRLGLVYTSRIAEIVRWHSFPQQSNMMTNGKEYPCLQRDSLKNITSWKSELTSIEIAKLKTQVQNISREFYFEDEW